MPFLCQQLILISMYVLCSCQAQSEISMLMTLSGPDIQRPLLRDGSRGIGVLECGTGGVKVELGALCVCPSMSVRLGRQEGG